MDQNGWQTTTRQKQTLAIVFFGFFPLFTSFSFFLFFFVCVLAFVVFCFFVFCGFVLFFPPLRAACRRLITDSLNLIQSSGDLYKVHLSLLLLIKNGFELPHTLLASLKEKERLIVACTAQNQRCGYADLTEESI